VSEGKSPDTKNEALAFALAFKATREIDKETPLQDALYVEKISRLLPTYSISSRTDDDVVLGYWLTGGASVSVKSFRRLRQTLSWLGAGHLKDIVEAAGFEVTEVVPNDRHRTQAPKQDEKTNGRSELLKSTLEDQPAPLIFELPGRPERATFINEPIVDIVQNRERYKALGIEFPSAVVLHGPPDAARHTQSSAWSIFSVGLASRSKHRVSPVPSFTKRAGRLPRSLTRRCRTHLRCS
jgi:cell division protease FtsH